MREETPGKPYISPRRRRDGMALLVAGGGALVVASLLAVGCDPQVTCVDLDNASCTSTVCVASGADFLLLVAALVLIVGGLILVWGRPPRAEAPPGEGDPDAAPAEDP